jgi:hypothetical protein
LSQPPLPVVSNLRFAEPALSGDPLAPISGDAGPPLQSQDPQAAQNPADPTVIRPAAPQQPVVCPYCRRPMATRADLSFTCGRCGDFPNYGRIYR